MNFSRSDKLTAALGFLGVALITIMMLPAMVFGMQDAHDVLWHLSWFLSFKDGFDAGHLYPRWAADQYQGLGSPVFFFYPPMANYFHLMTDFLTLRLFPADHVLAISSYLMCLSSGGAFYLWARNFLSPRLSILFAIAYMIAPYHLLGDFYLRAALAEFAAYIWIPLILTGIYKIVQDNNSHWALLLTLSLTGLFLTHLLTALIVAPPVALYTLWLLFKTRKSPNDTIRKIIFLGIAGSIGLGLAAIYLVPALTMMDFINSGALHMFSVRSSSLLGAIANPPANLYFPFKLFLTVCVYIGLLTYLFVEFLLKKSDAIFWISVAAFLCLCMFGFFGFIFIKPSPYYKIQFLWRMIVMLEFASITAAMVIASNAAPAQCRRIIIVAVTLFSCLALFQGYDFIQKFKGAQNRTSILNWSSVQARMSPLEYYPVDMGRTRDRSKALPNEKNIFTAKIIDGNGEITVATPQDGEFIVKANITTQASISIRQFYFPGWAAKDRNGANIEVRPAERGKLVTFDLPKGMHEITIYRVETTQERTGKIASLISLLGLVIFTLGIKIFGRQKNV